MIPAALRSALGAALLLSLSLAAGPARADYLDRITPMLHDIALAKTYIIRCRPQLRGEIDPGEVRDLQLRYRSYLRAQFGRIQSAIQEDTGKLCTAGWIVGADPICDQTLELYTDLTTKMFGVRPSVDECRGFVDLVRQQPIDPRVEEDELLILP